MGGAVEYHPQARPGSQPRAFSTGPPEVVELALTVRDPDLVAALAAQPEGRARIEFALSALRIGILALRQAQGRVDAETVRSEGERLLGELRRHLDAHRQAVTLELASHLKQYFDPESGRFNERVERLVKQDGELEQLLRRQIGLGDSELGRTLAAHFGEQSPLMDLLQPDESKGLLRALGQTLEEALRLQRERILREFSLDNRESALSRLVTELAERHGRLREDLQGSIGEVVGEFSLDNEESALSRLVRRVEQAQGQISREFSLDEEASALARMKRELLEVFDAQKQASAKFQQEVMTALSAMTARREEARRSTVHGLDFESEVERFLRTECEKTGDVLTGTGPTTGLISNCKVGDFVIALGPECVAAGAKIAVEAKESASYPLARALEELELARKNRGAGVGLFVASRRTAPEGFPSFARHGQDVVVTWDAEDPASDVVLAAGISVVRALCTDARRRGEAQAADFEAIERAIRQIEKQAGGFDEISRLSSTIRSNSEKILQRARLMRETLAKQVDVLEAKLRELEAALAAGDASG